MRGKIARWLSLALLLVVASSIAGVVHAPLPVLYVDPEKSSANPCEYFTVDISIKDITDLFSYGIKVSFNPYVLTVTSVQEGPFIKDQQTVPTAFIAKKYFNYVDVGCSPLGAVPGVSGSGRLFNITFHVEDAGTSDFNIYYSKLLDPTVAEIAHETADGSFKTIAEANLVKKSAWPEHHHFVVSKDEDFNGTHANQTLFAKVKNVGDLDLDVYASFDLVRDDGYVATLTSDVVVLAPGATVDLSANFTVNSTDAGKYAVTAKAWYSWSGYYYAQGEKVKTFSFAVIP